jgi:hypothetical protein
MISIKRFSIAGYSVLLFLLPGFASAACTTSGTPGVFENIFSYCSILELVEGILRVFMLVALPIVAFFIIFAGFNFVFARGNQEKLRLAKLNFFFVIIGSCLILGAWVLANLIAATVIQITS